MSDHNRIGKLDTRGYEFYLTFKTENGRKYFRHECWSTTTYEDGEVKHHSNYSEVKADFIEEINEAIENNRKISAQYGPRCEEDKEIDPETILQDTIFFENFDPKNPRTFDIYEK